MGKKIRDSGRTCKNSAVVVHVVRDVHNITMDQHGDAASQPLECLRAWPFGSP